MICLRNKQSLFIFYASHWKLDEIFALENLAGDMFLLQKPETDGSEQHQLKRVDSGTSSFILVIVDIDCILHVHFWLTK